MNPAQGPRSLARSSYRDECASNRLTIHEHMPSEAAFKCIKDRSGHASEPWLHLVFIFNVFIDDVWENVRLPDIVNLEQAFRQLIDHFLCVCSSDWTSRLRLVLIKPRLNHGLFPRILGVHHHPEFAIPLRDFSDLAYRGTLI